MATTPKTAKASLSVDKEALKKLKLVAVAYSYVQRELFPTQEAYIAEVEVEDRAAQVLEEIKKLGLEAKGYPADQYFLTNVLVAKSVTATWSNASTCVPADCPAASG